MRGQPAIAIKGRDHVAETGRVDLEACGNAVDSLRNAVAQRVVPVTCGDPWTGCPDQAVQVVKRVAGGSGNAGLYDAIAIGVVLVGR